MDRSCRDNTAGPRPPLSAAVHTRLDSESDLDSRTRTRTRLGSTDIRPCWTSSVAVDWQANGGEKSWWKLIGKMKHGQHIGLMFAMAKMPSLQRAMRKTQATHAHCLRLWDSEIQAPHAGPKSRNPCALEENSSFNGEPAIIVLKLTRIILPSKLIRLYFYKLAIERLFFPCTTQSEETTISLCHCKKPC